MSRKVLIPSVSSFAWKIVNFHADRSRMKKDSAESVFVSTEVRPQAAGSPPLA